MSKIIISMSQTETDVVEDVLGKVLEETNPTTDTNATNTKILGKRKANTTLLNKINLRKRIKRNQTIHKRRKQRKEDTIKSQIRKDKIQKLTNLNHESKKCCLLSPKRTYQAIYNEISYPKTAILPDNERNGKILKMWKTCMTNMA